MPQTISAEKQLTYYKQELEIVHSVLSRIHSEMDMDGLIEEIMEVMNRRIAFDEFNICLIEDEDYLFIHNMKHTHIDEMSEEVMSYMRDNFFGQRLLYKTSPVWVCKAARDGQEIFYPEVDPKTMTENERIYFKTTGTSAVLILPLKINEKIIGSIMFVNYGNKLLLSENEFDFIRRCVFMIARVIESQRMYEVIKRQNEELEFDLKLASRIQNNFLPKNVPGFSCVEIESRYIPMKLIGGDYFDFIVADDERKGFGVFISDVSGHGVPSAFITSMIKMVIQSKALRKFIDQPGLLLQELNETIKETTAGNFISAHYSYFDLEKRVMCSARAGHPPLWILNLDNGKRTEVFSRGKFLGIFEDLEFEEVSFPLADNQRFIFYTDGLSEALNQEGQMFEERLESLWPELYTLELNNFAGRLIDELLSHSLYGSREYLDDDVALVVLDIKNL